MAAFVTAKHRYFLHKGYHELRVLGPSCVICPRAKRVEFLISTYAGSGSKHPHELQRNLGL